VPLADGRPSAAKTGTEGIQTGPNSGQNSDAWMVGYTPQVSAAVWVGSGNSTAAIKDAYGQPEYGRDLPGRTWQLFMDSYLAGAPQEPVATTQLISVGDNQADTPAPSYSSPSYSSPSNSPPSYSPPTSSAPDTRSPSPRRSSRQPSTPPATPPRSSRPATPSRSVGAPPTSAAAA
jgi:membrane peptidoglycan carboxypeptidase